MAFRFLVLRRLPPSWRGSVPLLASHAAGVGAWACIALIAAAMPRLALQASGLVEPSDLVWPMALNVLGTTWGRAWMVQTVAALAALVGFVLARRARGVGWRVALVAVAVVAFSAAGMGHPIAGSRMVWLSVLDDAGHVLSVGVWVGTLLVITRIGFSGDVRSEGGGTVAALVSAFHRVALWSATVVVGSGILSVLLRVDHLRDLLTSSYGTVLFVKIGAVGVVASLGAWNSRTAVRRARSGLVRSARGTLAAELFFAVVTLAVTAVLVGTELPGGM